MRGRVDGAGGQVKIGGEVWSAVGMDGHRPLPPGTDVTVVDGVAQPWSTSCSFDLPVLSDDSPLWKRSAAYAEFLDLARVKPNTLGNTRMLKQL